MTSAAIQGVRGAFSHGAALQALGPHVEIVECRTFEAMFDAVVDGTAQYAVVPVENTLAGSVGPALDALLETAQQREGCPRTNIECRHGVE